VPPVIAASRNWLTWHCGLCPRTRDRLFVSHGFTVSSDMPIRLSHETSMGSVPASPPWITSSAVLLYCRKKHRVASCVRLREQVLGTVRPTCCVFLSEPDRHIFRFVCIWDAFAPLSATDLAVAIFPGNVGGPEALTEVYEILGRPGSRASLPPERLHRRGEKKTR
jgi:hypothetical protein